MCGGGEAGCGVSMGKKDKGREGIFKRMRKAVYGVSKERERQGTVNFKEKEEEGRNRKF